MRFRRAQNCADGGGQAADRRQGSAAGRLSQAVADAYDRAPNPHAEQSRGAPEAEQPAIVVIHILQFVARALERRANWYSEVWI